MRMGMRNMNTHRMKQIEWIEFKLEKNKNRLGLENSEFKPCFTKVSYLSWRSFALMRVPSSAVSSSAASGVSAIRTQVVTKVG